MKLKRRSVGILVATGLSVAASAGAAYVGFSHITVSIGSVSILSDANGRLEATVNAPIDVGDRVSTAAGARAEIALADGNRVQLDGESSVSADALAGSPDSDATETRITLEIGSLAVESIHSSSERALRIDTAEVSVYLAESGQVRVNADSRQGTSVIVRAGSAQVQTPAGSRTLSAGQYLTLRGDGAPEIAAGNFSRDRFDAWVADRSDGILEAHNSSAAKFVDGDYDEDAAVLDSYGDWDTSPSYGINVWRPRVSSDWSPYQDGYWADSALGASWVSSEPWGWMPYHYGNWFFDSGFGSWCWAPAYVYSPAWVYWCYTPGFVGWCPAGYYAYSSPFRRFWSSGTFRSGSYVSVSGLFNPARIDFRAGWSFVRDEHFGSRPGPGGIISGRILAPKLSGRVAVTSEPLRSMRGPRGTSGAEGMRRAIAAAPARIAGEAGAENSAAMAPFLARGSALPAETIRVIQQSHLATPGIGRASREIFGPGADRLPVAPQRQVIATARASGQPGDSRGDEGWRTLSGAPSGGSDWRARPGTAGRELGETSQREPWREHRSTNRLPPPRPTRVIHLDDWREHNLDPPARRVIDGIEHGRAAPPPREQRLSPPDRVEPRPAPPRPEFRPPPPRSEPRPAPPPPNGDHPHGRPRG